MKNENENLRLPEVQESLFGGIVVRKRGSKKVRLSLWRGDEAIEKSEPEAPPRQIPDYTGSLIVTWMYVAPTLQFVLLTGCKLGMPDPETTAVFPEDGPDAKPKACTRLTHELFRTIMHQLNETTRSKLGEDRARVIESRWEQILAWAIEEGWC